MTGEAGALGELVGGAIIARQFDGSAAAHGTHAHGACANCDRILHGHFCSHCGQAAHVTRSVAHLGEELLHGLTHFDGKAWRTLPALVFRPGRLTYDYIHGKRARYIAPMALFLFTVFLMFFVFGMMGGPDINGALAKVDGPTKQAVADLRRSIADTKAELAKPKLTPQTRDALAATLLSFEKASALAEARVAATQTSPPAPGAVKPTRTWQDDVAKNAGSNSLQIETGLPQVDSRIRKALLTPDFALYKVQEKAYKLSFLLVPLSFPVLWLMFCRRRDTRSFDHIVFALYSLSFMSLLTIFVAVLMKFDPTASAQVGEHGSISSGFAGIFVLVPPLHMFFQLKGAYRLRVAGALWRTAVLGVSSLMTLGLFAALIVVVGLAD